MEWCQPFALARARHGRSALHVAPPEVLLMFFFQLAAVTVAPEYRRLGIAAKFMEDLEVKSAKCANPPTSTRPDRCGAHFCTCRVDGWFVDLFVRVSNNVAVAMYKKLGYSVYRQIYGYYSGEEDAYDMRKALPRDTDHRSVVPLPHPVYPEDLD